MVKKSYTLHLGHQSMKFSQSDDATEHDAAWMMKNVAPDIVSYTELSDAGSREAIRRACQSQGYHPILFSQTASGLAFNPEVVKLKSKDYVLGSEAVTEGPNAAPKRYICWGHLKLDGEDIWYHTAHWLPYLAEGHGRVHRHNAMSRQMVAQVRKHAKSDGLSFFSGDINIDDKDGDISGYNQIMRQAGLLSIWDEMKVYPGTHGGPNSRTIDVIGSYNRDKRVVGKRYKVWPQQRSDHRPLSVWYELKRARVHTGGGGHDGGGNPPGTGPDPAQEDFFATGGNIDWSDYLDGAIYDLPSAIDDSDEPHPGGISE